jgi:hypothetical protein
MSIYKRGAVYWYDFEFKGERYNRTTGTKNKEAAKQIESAERVKLAKGEAGIHQRAAVPTLAEFASRFESAVVTLGAEKPATVKFYKEKLRRLLRLARKWKVLDRVPRIRMLRGE